MTNEQREAIETMQHWIEYEKKHKDEINKADELIHIQDTVLSLIKEHQEELKKQDRQIDLMAEWIEKHTKYYDEDGCYCEVEKEICKYDIECKDCIKQYFERKVEDETK